MVGYGQLHKQILKKEWEAFYVNYDLLQRMLQRYIDSPGASTMREYLQAFRDEWNKARLFVHKLDDMPTLQSVEVAKFCSQNRLALLKAGKKFTKHAPSVNLTISLGDFRGDRLGFDDSLTRFVDARIQEFAPDREAYMKEMFASIEELGLPLPKDENVRVGDEVPSARQVSELPDSFERESSKFWLQRGQVVAFVDLVTQRLGPYKFKGQKDSFNVITSIYLDNDAFDLYASRVARRDGAQLVRFRWYSEYADKHVTQVVSAVFVEVKTHRESWSGEKSKKERFEVPWNRMTDWLSGQWEPKKESLKALASQTLATIKGMRLKPKIMTQYRRFVFQNPRTSFLRISMDSRLELAAFKDKDLFTANWTDREPVAWCQKFSADMICEFPMVVVELKTECKFCDAPQWIQNLADVTESPLRDTEGKFSKYGCGVALMFYEAVKDLVELPQPMRQVYTLCGIEERDFLEGPGEMFKRFAGVQSIPAVPEHNRSVSLSDVQLASKSSGRVPDQREAELHDLGACDTLRVHARSGAAQSGVTSSGYANFDVESGDSKSMDDQSCFPTFRRPIKHFFGKFKRQPPPKKLQRSKKVEPKTLFANERTYLQWMQAGVLLTTLSLGLLSMEGDASKSGYIMAPIAVLVMGWSTLRYFIRAKAIENNEKDGYFDPYGPPVLAALLTVIILLTMINAFKR